MKAWTTESLFSFKNGLIIRIPKGTEIDIIGYWYENIHAYVPSYDVYLNLSHAYTFEEPKK